MSRESTTQRRIGPNRIKDWLMSLDQSTVVVAFKNLFRQSDDLNTARAEAVRQTAVALNHEINNPLTVVLGNAELLLMKEHQLPEEVKVRLKTIVTAGLRIRDAVSRLSTVTEAQSTTYDNRIQMIDSRDTSVSDM